LGGYMPGEARGVIADTGQERRVHFGQPWQTEEI
jgi:hypothetical protein